LHGEECVVEVAAWPSAAESTVGILELLDGVTQVVGPVDAPNRAT